MVELARLITDYKDMIIEINGIENYSMPFIQAHDRQTFINTSIEDVLLKLFESKIIKDKKKEVFQDTSTKRILESLI